MNLLGYSIGILTSALVLSCSGGAPGAGDGSVGNISSIQLALGTQAASGDHYRLSPASFTINGPEFPPDYTIDATAGADDLVVPVGQHGGTYRVVLNAGWQMQRVASDGSLTPVAATLLSQPEKFVSVQAYEATPVIYDFHLGASSLNLGISVDEGVLPGYDGKIYPTLYGQYSVTWQNGSGDCCYPTVSALLAAFPDKHIQQP